MSTAYCNEHLVIDELADLVAGARDRRDRDGRIALFDSLAALEALAHSLAVSEAILERVSECRFLAGILRDSVSPSGQYGTRAERHLWTAMPDLQASREPALQA